MMRKLSGVVGTLAFLLCACGQAPQSEPASADRAGDERMIYKDAETGRTVWRMTDSKMNDKHNYYSDQSWNPDMTKIAWSTAQYQASTGSIWIMDTDGSHFKKLVDPAPFNMHTGSRPGWSPDGTLIYYDTDKAVDLEGNPAARPQAEQEVFESSVHKSREFNQAYRKGPVTITRQMCYEHSAYQEELDRRPARMINAKWAPNKSVMMVGFSNENWDPDTDTWALSTEKPSPPTVKELFLIDADGTNFRRWVDYGNHHSWMPDSKHIIFNANSAQGGGLVVQHVDGRPYKKIAEFGGTHPSMNPQGTMVVTDVYSGEFEDYLVLIHVEDGRVEKLVKTPRSFPRRHDQTHCNPSWSPDGSMVIYDSDESGICQIYIVVIDEDAVRARFGDAAIAH